MNYINLSTKQIITPTYFKMLTGLSETDVESALKAGYGRVEYNYPTFNGDYYTLKPKAELTKMEGQEGRFVQEFDIVDRPVEESCQAVKERITAKRWEVETGGITLPDGTSVLTGIDDQNRIDSTISRMKDANIQSVKFKASSGWVELTQEQVQAIGVAIALHVEACFARECALHTACDEATTIEALKQIGEHDINEGWPVYETVGA